MRNDNPNEATQVTPDDPTFIIVGSPRGWGVHITWSDGEEGPSITFASRREAELWIKRDARGWLERLAALSPGEG